MAHSFRRSSYGGGSGSSSHHHQNQPRNGGYSTSSSSTRHHRVGRGATEDDDDYHQQQPHYTTHQQPNHHHRQHRGGGGGGYASDAVPRHYGGGYRGSNRAYYEEDDGLASRPQHAARRQHHQQQQQQYNPHHHRQHHRDEQPHQQQLLQELHLQHQHHLPTAASYEARQLQSEQGAEADAAEVSSEPGTPPSIMHVGEKIPLTAFFPEQILNTKGIVAYTPDSELPVDENEPIEAGRLPKKARSRTESATSTTSTRRESTSGETVSALEQFECEDVARHKRKEEAFKTALCDAYRKDSECSYGKQCRFAHGEHELRLPPQPRGKAHPKYKTQLCDKFSVQGYCPYGPRCQFIHMMKKGLALVEYEKKVRAGKISPTRECVEFIDEDDMESSYTRNNGRPYTVYQVDPRGYPKAGGGGERGSNGGGGGRRDGGRRRSYQDEYAPRNGGGGGGGSRHDRDRDYEPTDRMHRHRSMEALNADAPRVTYEKIPTTPKRAPVRPKELSLIHEETEEHESPPSSASAASASSSTRTPAWVAHLMAGGGALAPSAASAPSPRSAARAPRGPPKMEQIAEEADYAEEYRHRRSSDGVSRRSNRG